MSITSGPVSEAEAAGEKLAGKLEQDAPVTFGAIAAAILNKLAEYEFVIGLRKRQ